MKLKKSVQEATKALGFDTLHKHQIDPINSVLDHNDTIAVYPTGSGKSAIFQVPGLVNAEQLTLVIVPTLSLMFDQVQKLQQLGISAEYLAHSNTSKHRDIMQKTQTRQITFLYITPERLQSSQIQAVMKHNPPWLVVVDEAHCVLNWGFTFRADYLKIKQFVLMLSRRPTILAMTATAPPEYRKIIGKLIGMHKPKVHIRSLNRRNITLLKEDCGGFDLRKRLSRANYNIKKYAEDGRVIVYCATRKNVDLLANYLSNRFPGEVVKCHAFMDAELREKNELQFIRGQKMIMVASTAFGMGVDIPDIRLVLHFNLPLSAIDYYQQIGRAGRDGNTAPQCLSTS